LARREFVIDYKISVDSISVNFSQSGNTLGTTNEIESLEVSIETQSVGITDEPPFFVFRTDGWSIDSLSDLKPIIKFVNELVDSAKKVK